MNAQTSAQYIITVYKFEKENTYKLTTDTITMAKTYPIILFNFMI